MFPPHLLHALATKFPELVSADPTSTGSSLIHDLTGAKRESTASLSQLNEKATGAPGSSSVAVNDPFAFDYDEEEMDQQPPSGASGSALVSPVGAGLGFGPGPGQQQQVQIQALLAATGVKMDTPLVSPQPGADGAAEFAPSEPNALTSPQDVLANIDLASLVGLVQSVQPSQQMSVSMPQPPSHSHTHSMQKSPGQGGPPMQVGYAQHPTQMYAPVPHSQPLNQSRPSPPTMHAPAPMQAPIRGAGVMKRGMDEGPTPVSSQVTTALAPTHNMTRSTPTHRLKMSVSSPQELSPTQIRILSRTLFIGNLPPQTSPGDVVGLFREFGVDSITVNNKNHTAFVKLNCRANAERCKELFGADDGRTRAGGNQGQSPSLFGQPLRVNWACGFGPKDRFDRRAGTSTFDATLISDPDKKWIIKEVGMDFFHRHVAFLASHRFIPPPPMQIMESPLSLLNEVWGQSSPTGGREYFGGLILEEPDTSLNQSKNEMIELMIVNEELRHFTMDIPGVGGGGYGHAGGPNMKRGRYN